MTSASPSIPSVPDVAGNASIAMLAKALYLLTRLCLPPLVLAHIPIAEYGLWTACFVLVMFVGLTDVGFSNVYVRFTARFHAAGDVAAINRLLSTGVTVLSGMALVVLAGVWLSLPSILDFLKVAPEYRDKASVLILGTTGIFLLDLTLGAYCYLLHGLQRIKEEQQVAIIGYLAELALIAILLRAGYGVYALLTAFALRYAWSLACFARLAHRFVPGLQLRPRHFDRQMLRHFLGFGATVQASALLGTTLYALDRLLAGFFLGPKGIALFELAAKLPVSALTIPSAISNVTLASAAGHAARENVQAIRELHQQATRSTSLLAAVPLAYIAAFADPIGKAWLGKGGDLGAELHGLALIMTLSALWSHLHIITGPGSATLRAMGRAGNEFVYHGLRIGFLAISIGIALATLPSIEQGLAWGLALGGGAAALAYLVAIQRILDVPLSRLVNEVLLPGLVAYPVAGLFRVAWNALLPETSGRWESLVALGVTGVLYVICYAAISWLVVLTVRERDHLTRLIGRFFRRPQWRSS